MRLVWIIVLVLMIGALLYLTFFNRAWPANSYVRVAVIMAIGAVAGIVWMIVRSPPKSPTDAD